MEQAIRNGSKQESLKEESLPSPSQKGRNLQIRLISLLLSVVIPMLAVQVYIYYDRVHIRRNQEFQANLELARAAGRAFESLVHDVLHQELAIGVAATASPPLTPSGFFNLLDKSARESAAVKAFSWVSPEGRVLASSNPELTGASISDKAYFTEIVSGREWLVTDLFPSMFKGKEGKPFFGIIRSTRDEAGTLLGVVVASVTPDMLDRVLDIERSRDAGISIIDSMGRHAYRYPATDFTWEQRNWLKLYPPVEGALRGDEVATTVVSEITGKKRLVGFTPIPSIGWVAAASRAEEEVMTEITSRLLPHVILMLLITLVGFAVALFLSRSVSASARRLRNQALALGRGEYGEGIQIYHISEFQELADSLKSMAEKVRIREAALRVSEEKYRRLFHSSPDSIILASFEEGRLIEVNDSFCGLIDYPMDEIVGKTFLELGICADPKEREAIRETLARERRVHDVSCRLRARSGDIKYVLISIESIEVDGSACLLGVARDITELKRMEEELRRSRNELELRVQERTTELRVTNQALVEHAARLQKLNDELQDFAFVASHDLQEPLRKIQTFGRMIAGKYQHALGEEGRDYLMRVTRSASRMSDLLRSLLAYSRIATGANPFERTELGAVVEGAVSDLELTIMKSGGRVEIGELPAIDADAPQLRQLFQNLLSNSIKYCRESEKPIVRISGKVFEGTCRVLVEDNGIGFEQRYVDKIFKPFQRLHGGSSKYEGTGMGLAICRKIVERHGGNITATSAPGRGTTFIITLPSRKNGGRGFCGNA